MIRNPEKWREWEESGPLSEPADFKKNLQIVDAMYQFARSLGVFPPKDPLDGIEADIRIAKALNVPARP